MCNQFSSARLLNYGIAFAGFSSCIRNYSQHFLNQICWVIRNKFSSTLHLHYGITFAGFSLCIRGVRSFGSGVARDFFGGRTRAPPLVSNHTNSLSTTWPPAGPLAQPSWHSKSPCFSMILIENQCFSNRSNSRPLAHDPPPMTRP